ncbi:type I polyketide synthase [cf. Phormidesmis sp. LEGE 11477]|uniref:type I polyketide synthase n=1 Tax=cf. Phormidesmis sp. LEGE 11477 TaxID=1828680 RepID=UPI001881C1BB|nr:type I polyketide synthase [cf. Phormidesmis sp. LEGE 11477]MBE9060858.1 acyltransferase domain-containing protein [cf. Phormidesmis sp. LEGE 11477]
MSEVSRNSNLPTQTSDRVLKALKAARSQIEAIEQAKNERIAIVGMAGRFPGANNLKEFWTLISQGQSGIQFLSDEALLEAGVPESTFQQPNYVRAYASFPDPTGFDAAFFGYSPREAELIDPQHRVFLECAWSALEDAGYDSQQYDGSIGVYGGAALNSYVVNLHSQPDIRESISPVQAVVSNVMGLMPTRVSYQLDLKGPSCGIQTGCSTAIVAVHSACQSLLSHECDMALAGGVTISSAQPQGYLYQSESIASPDGICRAFDAEGQGTVFGNGVGIVVLKRLQAAITDKDHIYAVIKGSAINNDGADKINLIAPSVSGQATVIKSAIEQSGISPNTIDYVEAHGTGTHLGDPIEVAALNKAFNDLSTTDFSTAAESKTVRTSCALGSVKTNVGHLDAAAGAAGLIKTVLSLQHKTIPASLNYQRPNPKIDFQNGPFVVNQHRQDWTANGTPRRAGVSSFGMGGTNAHMILEEAPEACTSEAGRPWQLIPLSAKTLTALDTLTQNLADHLLRHADLSIADVAYTLQVGRRSHSHRRFFVCQSTQDAVQQLSKPDGNAPNNAINNALTASANKSVVFMFPGQGAQHIDMAKGLYQTEPVFKQAIDQCASILARENIALLELLYPSPQPDITSGKAPEKTTEKLYQTAYAQPALFAIEYALAQLWMSWNVRPQAMIGHSIGEYVAACIAGVFSLEDALWLVAARSRLMQNARPGAMLSVLAAADTLRLPKDAEIAVINAPQSCVISGPTDTITAFSQQLESQDIPCRLLATSHAFHSAMMESALSEFSQALKKITLSPPEIDIISNLTGTWLADSEATDPNYWVKHLRYCVRFSQGITEVLNMPNTVLLEVGPGNTLTKLARQNLTATDRSDDIPILSSLPHPKDSNTDLNTLTETLGKLWQTGVPVNWRDLYQQQQQPRRQRLSLPTYPFERKSYWIPLRSPQDTPTPSTPKEKAPDQANWFYIPSWKRLPLVAVPEKLTAHQHLVLADQILQPQLNEQLEKLPTQPELAWTDFSDFQALVSFIQTHLPLKSSTTLTLLTTNSYAVTPHDSLDPNKAKAQGLSQVIAQEYPSICCRFIDIDSSPSAHTLQAVSRELTSPYNLDQRQVAYRSGQRWVRAYEALPLPEQLPSQLKRGGTYVIAGDLIEGLGMVYAQALIKEWDAKLILLGRAGLPAASEWEKWLLTHGPQHGASQLIRKLQTLGREDEQFCWFSGSLADADWVSASIRTGLERLGKTSGNEITGVFHADVMGDRASCEIAQLTHAEIDRICQNKVDGMRSLQQALVHHPVGFYVLQSSLSSVVGGIGFGAYAAANSYLDTLAIQQNNARNGASKTPSPHWLSLNWDACKLDDVAPSASELMALAMTAEEVWQTTQRALSQPGLSQLIISPRPLAPRLTAAFTPQPIQSTANSHETSTSSIAPSIHSRPTLATEYAAPRTPVEQAVAQAMGDLLGIAEVGIHDNFFELGGHSLLAIQAVTQLRQKFPVELPMRAFLFEAPTVAGIAGIIQEQIDESEKTALSEENKATMESLLDQIESMPPESMPPKNPTEDTTSKNAALEVSHEV